MKGVDICKGRSRTIPRHHDNRFVSEIPVTERLLHGSPPVLEFPFESMEQAALHLLLQGEGGELARSRFRFPSDPDQIRHSKACQRELPGSNSSRFGPFEIGPFERPHEVRFAALAGRGVAEVFPSILADGLQLVHIRGRFCHAEITYHRPRQYALETNHFPVGEARFRIQSDIHPRF